MKYILMLALISFVPAAMACPYSEKAKAEKKAAAEREKKNNSAKDSKQNKTESSKKAVSAKL